MSHELLRSVRVSHGRGEVARLTPPIAKRRTVRFPASASATDTSPGPLPALRALRSSVCSTVFTRSRETSALVSSVLSATLKLSILRFEGDGGAAGGVLRLARNLPACSANHCLPEHNAPNAMLQIGRCSVALLVQKGPPEWAPPRCPQQARKRVPSLIGVHEREEIAPRTSSSGSTGETRSAQRP